MTQQEFYLRSILALASNPRYVTMKSSDDDTEECTFPDLDVDMLLDDASYLFEKTQKSWEGDLFDKDSVNSSLSDINTSLNNLDEKGIRAYCEIEQA